MMENVVRLDPSKFSSKRIRLEHLILGTLGMHIDASVLPFTVVRLVNGALAIQIHA